MIRLPAVLILLLLSASTAAAADISLVDIFRGEGDPQTNEYLNMVFGPLFPVVGSVGAQTETLVSRLIANFNVIFFAIGLLLLVYNIIVGVTETAHDGSVLGQRHSSLWSPIRMVVAAASLIPLPTGYNGAQHAIAYVVKAGTATGSFFWDETVDAIVEDRMPVAAPDYASLDAQFLQAVWRMELCTASYNIEVAKGGDLARMTGRWDGQVPDTYHYSIPDRMGACGKISLPPVPAGFDRVAASAGGSYATWHEQMKAAIDRTLARYRDTAEKVATNASAREALPAPRNLAEDVKAWRAEHKRVTDPLVDTIAERAAQAAGEELTTTGTATADTKLASNMKAGGWTQAGFYYSIVSRFSADASAVQRMMPVAAPGDAIGATSNPGGSTYQAVKSQMSTWWFGDRDGDTREFLAEVINTYNIAVNWWNESVARSNIQAFTNERQAFADTAGEMATYIPSPSSMFDAFNYLDPRGDQEDPLIALMTIGNSLAVGAGTAIAALALLAAFPVFGGASIFIGTVLGWVLSGTIFAGMFISFVLPLIPTLIWVLSIAAFLLLVVEAIFAGPLWAIAHLSMDPSGGLAGPGARRGYVMLLALFLTPVLMLFGFLAGMAIFRVAGTLINGGFYYAMTAAQSLSTDGGFFSVVSVFGIFATLIMMILLYVVILERSFSLGGELPGRVLRWFDSVAVDLDDNSANRARISAAGGAAALGGGFKQVGGQANRAIEKGVAGTSARRDGGDSSSPPAIKGPKP